jgi:hypothetical protein
VSHSGGGEAGEAGVTWGYGRGDGRMDEREAMIVSWYTTDATEMTEKVDMVRTTGAGDGTTRTRHRAAGANGGADTRGGGVRRNGSGNGLAVPGLTFSQRCALGRAAEESCGARGDAKRAAGAEAAGLSGATYARLCLIVRAADGTTPVPDEIRDLAIEWLGKLDRGETQVNTAADVVRHARGQLKYATNALAEVAATREPPPPSEVVRTLGRIETQLSGSAIVCEDLAALDLGAVLTRAEAHELVLKLSKHNRSVARLLKALRPIGRGEGADTGD